MVRQPPTTSLKHPQEKASRLNFKQALRHRVPAHNRTSQVRTLKPPFLFYLVGVWMSSQPVERRSRRAPCGKRWKSISPFPTVIFPPTVGLRGQLAETSTPYQVQNFDYGTGSFDYWSGTLFCDWKQPEIVMGFPHFYLGEEIDLMKTI